MRCAAPSTRRCVASRRARPRPSCSTCRATAISTWRPTSTTSRASWSTRATTKASSRWRSPACRASRPEENCSPDGAKRNPGRAFPDCGASRLHPGHDIEHGGTLTMIEPYNAVGLIPSFWGIRRREEIKHNIEHLKGLTKAAFWLSNLDIPVKLLAIPEGAMMGFNDEVLDVDHADYANTCCIDIPGP